LADCEFLAAPSRSCDLALVSGLLERCLVAGLGCNPTVGGGLETAGVLGVAVAGPGGTAAGGRIVAAAGGSGSLPSSGSAGRLTAGVCTEGDDSTPSATAPVGSDGAIAALGCD